MASELGHATISVIIPCFNHGEFVREAVESVLATGRRDIELIVVDDGSTDARTEEEMGKLASVGVCVIHQKNEGLAGARNAAIAAARGEYIFPLDADDRLTAGWIESALKILDSDPAVGVIYGDAQCFGKQKDLWRVGRFDANLLLDRNFIHCSALYRRCIWEEVGGYDGGMPMQGFEDWDFWLCAFERGWKFHYLPEVFFEYRRSDESMITKTAGREAFVKEYVAKKHGFLYRRAWQESLVDSRASTAERQSIRWAIGHLFGLVKARTLRKISTGKWIRKRNAVALSTNVAERHIALDSVKAGHREKFRVT